MYERKCRVLAIAHIFKKKKKLLWCTFFSHMSDVHSYGMLVLGMTGGRSNSNDHKSDGSKMYFADMVYRHLTQTKVYNWMVSPQKRRKI